MRIIRGYTRLGFTKGDRMPDASRMIGCRLRFRGGGLLVPYFNPSSRRSVWCGIFRDRRSVSNQYQHNST